MRLMNMTPLVHSVHIIHTMHILHIIQLVDVMQMLQFVLVVHMVPTMHVMRIVHCVVSVEKFAFHVSLSVMVCTGQQSAVFSYRVSACCRVGWQGSLCVRAHLLLSASPAALLQLSDHGLHAA